MQPWPPKHNLGKHDNRNLHPTPPRSRVAGHQVGPDNIMKAAQQLSLRRKAPQGRFRHEPNSLKPRLLGPLPCLASDSDCEMASMASVRIRKSPEVARETGASKPLLFITLLLSRCVDLRTHGLLHPIQLNLAFQELRARAQKSVLVAFDGAL